MSDDAVRHEKVTVSVIDGGETDFAALMNIQQSDIAKLFAVPAVMMTRSPPLGGHSLPLSPLTGQRQVLMPSRRGGKTWAGIQSWDTTTIEIKESFQLDDPEAALLDANVVDAILDLRTAIERDGGASDQAWQSYEQRVALARELAKLDQEVKAQSAAEAMTEWARESQEAKDRVDALGAIMARRMSDTFDRIALLGLDHALEKSDVTTIAVIDNRITTSWQDSVGWATGGLVSDGVEPRLVGESTTETCFGVPVTDEQKAILAPHRNYDGTISTLPSEVYETLKRTRLRGTANAVVTIKAGGEVVTKGVQDEEWRKEAAAAVRPQADPLPSSQDAEDRPAQRDETPGGTNQRIARWLSHLRLVWRSPRH